MPCRFCFHLGRTCAVVKCFVACDFRSLKSLPPTLPPSLRLCFMPRSRHVLSCPVRNTLACLPPVFLQSMLDVIAVALRDNELQAKAEERRKKREAVEKKRRDLEKSVLVFFLLLRRGAGGVYLL